MLIKWDSLSEIDEDMRKINRFIEESHLSKFINLNILTILQDPNITIMNLKNYLLEIFGSKKRSGHPNLFDQFCSYLLLETDDACRFSLCSKALKYSSENAPLLQLASDIDDLCNDTISSIGEWSSKWHNRELFRTDKTFRKSFEVFHISRFVVNLAKEQGFTEVIDVGCGRGDLCRAISQLNSSLSTLGIDMKKSRSTTRDPLLAFLDKSPDYFVPQAINQRAYNFHRMKLPDEKFLNALDKPYRFSVGLHSCGNLAVEHLINAARSSASGVLSIGCCYHLLSTNACGVSGCGHLSSKTALHLANMRHAPVSSSKVMKALCRKRMYRYALEMLKSQKSHWRKRLYYNERKVKSACIDGRSFPEYVMNWIGHAKGKTSHAETLSSHEKMYLRTYFRSPKHQKLLFVLSRLRMFQIRLLGKPLETLVHLNRAAELHKMFGATHHIAVRRFFPEALSARNIGILMVRKRGITPKFLT